MTHHKFEAIISCCSQSFERLPWASLKFALKADTNSWHAYAREVGVRDPKYEKNRKSNKKDVIPRQNKWRYPADAWERSPQGRNVRTSAEHVPTLGGWWRRSRTREERGRREGTEATTWASCWPVLFCPSISGLRKSADLWVEVANREVWKKHRKSMNYAGNNRLK